MNEQKVLIGMIFLAILALLAVFAGNPKMTFAATVNQTNVSVEVNAVTQITVLPTNMTWYDVNPGSVGGLKSLNIKNSGSQNITTIYGYADTITSEPNNPIPIGTSLSYSSGGVLMFKKNGTAEYFYTDRLEWNITTPAGVGTTNCANAVAWGYYRNATSGAADYLWCLNNGTEINASTGCNSTGTTFYMETDADVGSTATRNPDIGGGAVSEQEEWGVFSGIASGALNGHCIAASRDCSKVLIYRYDKRTSPNFAACTQDENLREDQLTPGAEFPVQLDVWVPQGIPAGWMAASWLTIEAGS